MFSFPRAGCVETGKTGHAYVFDSMSGESYIFIRNLAVGAQSKVQLVANISTHEIVVRKVSKKKLPLSDVSELSSVPKDREVLMLDCLDLIMRSRPSPANTITPRWASYLHHENIPTMSGGPRPRLECTQVSYWKLYNCGDLADLVRVWRSGSVGQGRDTPFPVSFVARCIAQVCETLHVMYQAGPQAIYHCDLHLGNVFVHFDPNSGDGSELPDFYIGDFGWARTAGEALADGVAQYGSGTTPFGPWSERPPGFETPPSPPPGTAPPGQRRRWDVERFGTGLESFLRLAFPATGPFTPPNQPPPSEQAHGLQRLMMMMSFMDSQEQTLAARNPHSHPPSLEEVVREAKILEKAALAVERLTIEFTALLLMLESWAEKITQGGPYVFTGDLGLSSEMRKAQAENYGNNNIDGPWSLTDSV
ncbi:hypothetical protein C8A00DRAFT_11954 [Chaetomidium leptoderma]|uniref:Protein kinase domain-containing protein n=1 Tax=Chaetomidium leptoderma TaxID=669021 RepID=A0AAN6VSW1_9PEZI|nr:hypothetical protein C8A00DRAFT_11954 [Chaetomidium leptoderma]